MLEREVRTECIVQDAATAEGAVTPGTQCVDMLGEKQIDATKQAQAKRQVLQTSRGEPDFVRRNGVAKNKLPSKGYCKTDSLCRAAT